MKKGEKSVSVGFRVFGKKMEIERKVPGEKKMVKILLSSCSLVNFKLKLWEKSDENFQIIFGWIFFLELKLQFC